MKTVCSFCNTVINPGESPDNKVSHGVCTACHKRILAEYRFNVRKFLDMFDAPVFLVDSDVNILAANTSALEFVRKPMVHFRGKICGKVLDCINSCLPRGCGRTPFCPDCAIRNSVNQTYMTGTSVTARPAVVNLSKDSSVMKLHLLVSTRKDGDIVLLRLEPVESG